MKTSRAFLAAAFAGALGLGGLTSGCAAKYLKVEDPNVLKGSDEFDKAVKIVVDESEPEPAKPEPARPEPEPAKSAAPVKKGAPVKKTGPVPKPKKGAKTKAAAPAGPAVHEPADVEDGTGFVGRRPSVDPFRVGEAVVHDVHYFKISAGKMTLKVDPMATVNGKKAYNFVTQLETYPTFSTVVYAVDDKAVTLVDFDQLIPRVFTLHVKETSQRREARSFFDFDKLQARYWEKKVTEKNGVEEKKLEWEILPYSQNVFSAIFYMRLFKWETGKEYAFRVADDEQNLIFRGTALERETLDTEIGPMKAIKVQAKIMSKGIFKQVGDIHIWLSDDDRKYVLRIESKIKIGTLISEIVSLDPGKP